MRWPRPAHPFPPFSSAGLYIDEIINVGREELAMECDYVQEAAHTRKAKALLAETAASGAGGWRGAGVAVPSVVDALSTARVLTTEWAEGVPVDKLANAPQALRDAIARRMLRLTMTELFQWRFMQVRVWSLWKRKKDRTLTHPSSLLSSP
jgi:aarF domain-containing kinase